MREIPSSTAELLRRIAESDVVQPIDVQFGRFLAGLDTKQADTLALTGALLSYARGRGHSCIALRNWAERPFPGIVDVPVLPNHADWVETLRVSGIVGSPGEMFPLVLDGEERVYLYRYWQAEQRIARHVADRLHAHGDEALLTAAQAPFQALFGEGADVMQAVAAVSALRNTVCVISGGPGTGKTTTVARILALLLSVNPNLKIMLATPTGKAAQRLGSVIEQQIAALPVDGSVRDRLPRSASTLHRMLGYHPQMNRYRYHAQRQIPADVVVVDESSMADLLLFEAVLEAVPTRAKLILLGDPYQLASVETGFVFGDLCRSGAEPYFSSSFAKTCAVLGGMQVSADEQAGRLHDAVVTLQKNYRFGSDSGIGALAEAVRSGNAATALDCLRSTAYPDVLLVNVTAMHQEILQRMGPYARRLCRCASVDDALKLLEEMRLLSATRWGPRGVQGLNRLIEAWLLQEGLCRDTQWYRGRPILVTANDYALELFNGDLGICWREGRQTMACFLDGSGGVRRIPLAKLPPHESAWAMTVHKSQGSEFGDVLLVLPEKPTELLSRELLYTAVTRARQSVTIFGDPDIVAYGIHHPEIRDSALTEKLAAMMDASRIE